MLRTRILYKDNIVGNKYVWQERLNAWTHGTGAVLALIGLITLAVASALYGSAWHIVSFCIFGATLLLMYTASTIYHAVTHKRVKGILQRVDHASIYLLIAGSYTPFVLVALRSGLGWTIFGIVWGMALAGLFLEIFRRKRHDVLETMIFLGMGWLSVLAIKPLVETLPVAGIVWLVSGGLAYTVGTIFYLADSKIPFNHAVWHLFVLGGSACHFVCVLWFLLPIQ